MTQYQDHTREQHDKVNQFMARLNELKSDTTLNGTKLLVDLNAFKDRIS